MQTRQEVRNWAEDFSIVEISTRKFPDGAIEEEFQLRPKNI